MWSSEVHNTRFALVVLRGAVEGDSTKYFGSILEYQSYARAAQDCGLVMLNKEWGTGRLDEYASEHIPTSAGIDFYRRHRMNDWLLGRGYTWTGENINAAIGELLKDVEA